MKIVLELHITNYWYKTNHCNCRLGLRELRNSTSKPQCDCDAFRMYSSAATRAFMLLLFNFITLHPICAIRGKLFLAIWFKNLSINLADIASCETGVNEQWTTNQKPTEYLKTQCLSQSYVLLVAETTLITHWWHVSKIDKTVQQRDIEQTTDIVQGKHDQWNAGYSGTPTHSWYGMVSSYRCIYRLDCD